MFWKTSSSKSILLVLLFLIGSALASSYQADFKEEPTFGTIQPRACSSVPKCPDCAGVNNPNGNGLCRGGDLDGCPCESVCGTPNGRCDKNGCQGVNSHDVGGSGVCTAGSFQGCNCAGICGDTSEGCDANGCDGWNSPAGLPGVCLGGTVAGCECASVCGPSDGSCEDCGGVNNICQTGAAKGCSCGTSCGNDEAQGCEKNGCDGINFPEFGVGVCQNKFAGCPCIPTCGPTNGPCSDKNCQGGQNGRCSTGLFLNCFCDVNK